MTLSDFSRLTARFRSVHTQLVRALATLDGQPFRSDSWNRPEGGGGVSCVIEEGALFERGGVNFSHVHGTTLPPSATRTRPDLKVQGWEAAGISLVLHPRNPYVPTVHMNVRFFQAHDAQGTPLWWCGGGMDLTPYYPFLEDVQHFHRTCKAALDRFDPTLYPAFKSACDAYFFLPHRQEPRGVGGIFFDDFSAFDQNTCLDMAEAVVQALLDAYLPIVERRRALPYAARERHFQSLRRARYVEFNLLHDRGTLFGLQSGGRTESILMSMPPLAAWRYDWHPEPGSPEAQLYDDFLKVREWI